jgi:hypothetical protein
VTFTATVSHATGTAAPTGLVTFSTSSVALGSSELNASGLATFTTNTLPANRYSVTAIYGGDANNAASSSSVTVLSVVDFQITASPTTVTVSGPGQSGSAALTITPLSGFNQNVSFSCTGLPSGANCSFASTSGGATLTIATTTSKAGLLEHPFGRGQVTFYALLLPGLLGLVLAGTHKRSLAGMRVLSLLCAVGFCSLCVACGMTGSGSGGVGGANSGTPPGSSTVTVIATAGSISHQTTITLTVQ